MARYRVAEGTQVNAGGRLYTGGEVLDVVPHDLSALLAAGVVVEVVDHPKEPKARKS